MHWMRLTVDGTAGHGSMTNTDNAVTELCEAVARVGRHRWPVRVTKTVRSFLDELSDALGTPSTRTTWRAPSRSWAASPG